MAKSKYVNIDLAKLKYLIQVEGYEHKDIYTYLGISHDTFYTWIKKYPDFAEAVKLDKSLLLQELKDTLIKRAKGYFIEESVTETITNSKGETTTKVKNVKKWIQTDTALVFALANLDPDNWRRTDKNEIVENIIKGIEAIDISKADLQKKIKKLRAQNEKEVEEAQT